MVVSWAPALGPLRPEPGALLLDLLQWRCVGSRRVIIISGVLHSVLDAVDDDANLLNDRSEVEGQARQ